MAGSASSRLAETLTRSPSGTRRGWYGGTCLIRARNAAGLSSAATSSSTGTRGSPGAAAATANRSFRYAPQVRRA